MVSIAEATETRWPCRVAMEITIQVMVGEALAAAVHTATLSKAAMGKGDFECSEKLCTKNL